jgi:hypothetical protein
MSSEIDSLLKNISLLTINENNEILIIKIQSWFRGCIFRLKRLPLIMYKVQKYLISESFKFSNQTDDGRINSSLDENEVILLLKNKFKDRIRVQKIRMWFDILLFDNMYNWLPVNIKTTTTNTNDNSGNLSLCVYSYTNETLDLHNDKNYKSGKLSEILFNKLKNKEYNKIPKKDYYFIVLNKLISNDIIINSIKGLTILTSNLNNLPFQICWNRNRSFKAENINKKIKLFINCLQKPKPNWKEVFILNIRTIKL